MKMTNTNINNNADKAWSRLYERLEGDGLVPDQTSVVKRVSFRKVRTIAAAAAIVIVASVTYLLSPFAKDNADLRYISFLNEDSLSVFATTLEDGSAIYLANNTTIELPEHFSGDKREIKLSGDAYFQVARDEKKPFVIETERIQVKVLGTSFNVRCAKDIAPSLSVNTGLVEVTLKKTGEKVRVKAGESLLVASDVMKIVKTEDLSLFDAYTTNIRFKDERLENVVKILNRNSQDANLEISPDIADRKITATFDNSSPEVVQELISLALNLKSEKRGERYYLHQ